MSDPNAAFQPPPPPVPPAPEPPKPKAKYLLIPGLVIIVIGIAILGAGFAKVLPGGVGTGVVIAFFGIILIALSFVNLPAHDPEAPLSTVEQLTGIFYEPTRVFRSLRGKPSWIAPLLVIGLLNAAYIAAFTQRLTAERIVNYTVDKMADTPFIPAEAVERARAQGLEDAKSPVQKVNNAIKSIVGVFIGVFFISALYLVALLAFGGRVNFWQAVSIFAFASLPAAVITKVVSFVLLYLKSPDDIHPLMGQETLLQDNLGILLAPKDHPVLFVLAASIGILSFYKLWLVAKGLKEGATKVSSTAAWGVAITMWLLGLLLVASVTAAFPSFIS
jgi:Yip1 domain